VQPRVRTVGWLSGLGLLLLPALGLSFLRDFGTKPDVACERSGGDICFLVTFHASRQTIALTAASLCWVALAICLLARHSPLCGAYERSTPAERVIVAAAVSVTTLVLAAALLLTRALVPLDAHRPPTP
jgi:hypothetical protein